MLDPVRQEIITSAHTVVVKVGTNVLTAEDGRLDLERLQALADQIQRLRQLGRRVALVSSGAIGAGAYVALVDMNKCNNKGGGSSSAAGATDYASLAQEVLNMNPPPQ